MSRPAPHRVALPDREDTILFHPHFSQWPVLLQENGRMEPGTTDGNRDELLQSARDYTRRVFGMRPSPGVPRYVIATGHQCMWHHCGIWAKNVATCRLAEAVGGAAVHLILDHDVRSSSLLLPCSESGARSGVREIEIERSPNPVPIELRPAPEKARIEAFVGAVCEAVDNPICGGVWPAWIQRPGMQRGAFAGMTDFITFMQGTLNFSLGLHLLYLPVSRLSASAAFVAFAVELMRNARRFASCYNDAVAQWEPAGVRLLDIRNTDRAEMPLWLVLPDGRRESLWVELGKDDRIRIGTERQEMDAFDASSEVAGCARLKALLVRHQCRLRPKAITLTLFARMVLADWFVHGFGAQGYEAVTDCLIERWFGRRVPQFGIATCTLRLPGAGARESAASNDASLLRHRLHHMTHNPEKYLSPEQLRDDRMRRLVKEKASLLARLGGNAEDAGRKKAMHAQLQQINERLFHCLADDLVGSSQGAGGRRPAPASCEARDSREFFFGLFPAERLRRVAATVNGITENVERIQACELLTRSPLGSV